MKYPDDLSWEQRRDAFDRLKRIALWLNIGCWVAALVAGVCFLASLDGGGGPSVAVAACLAGAAGGLWISSQVLHLRAAAEWIASRPAAKRVEQESSVVERDEYFLLLDGKPSGPHTEAQIDSMLGRSLIGIDTPCCRNGDDAWGTVETFRAARSKSAKARADLEEFYRRK